MSDIVADLKWRYACKAFDPEKKLDTSEIEAIKESLRLSASSFGLQPWKFVFVENKELREKLVPVSWNQAQVKDASHLIVMCAPTKFDASNVDSFIDSVSSQRGVEKESLEGYAGMMKGFGIPITDAEIKLPYARRFLKSRDTADIYTFTSIDPLGSWALGKARRKAQDVEDAAVKAQNDKDKRDGIRREPRKPRLMSAPPAPPVPAGHRQGWRDPPLLSPRGLQGRLGRARARRSGARRGRGGRRGRHGGRRRGR